MSTKIAICVNHFYPSVGGAEIVAKTLADHFSQSGFDVVVLTRVLGTKRRNPREFSYEVFEYRPGDIVTFENKLEKLKPDFLFIYSDVFDFFRNIAFKRNPYRLIIALCGANWLYTHKNYIQQFYRNLSNIHAIICHSKAERDFRLCSNDAVQKKTYIIPNGVWPQEFDNNTLTRKQLAPHIADKQWLINISNFFPGKGQEHIVEILSDLPEPEKTAYIQISSDIDFEIGKVLEGKWKAKCQKLKDLGLHIEFKKNIPREQVVGFLKQSNVFISGSEKEVAPLVLLESMSCSIPWISTNIGNAQDLRGGICIPSAKDFRFHSVFNNNVKAKFRDAIRNALTKQDQLGSQGRDQIDQELTWNNILPNYSRLVENA